MTAAATETKTAARKIVERPTSKLHPYERNSRQHPKSQIDQLAKLLPEYGWTNPAVIDEDNRTLAGHGRVLAATPPRRTASTRTAQSMTSCAPTRTARWSM